MSLTKTVTIEQMVRQTKDLPSLPEAALRVVRLANDDSAGAETIAGALSNDQTLAARVLRLANSSYYGMNRQVTTLQDAVVILGTRTVRHLALLASTFPWLSRAIPGYDMPPRMLWRHSVTVALTSQIFARKTRLVSPDEAFIAGLLHDIGKIVLAVWMEEDLTHIVQRAEAGGIPFDAAEGEWFGFTHADVGGYLAREWNLPESLERAIVFHHNPENAPPNNPIVDIVHVADALTINLGLGLGGDGLNYRASDHSFKALDLTMADIEAAADELVETIARAAPMFEFS